MRYFIVLLSLLLLLGCSHKESLVEKPAIMNMAKKIDPNIQEILPESIDKGVKCSTYGAGCVGAFVVETSMVQFIMVRFDSVAACRQKATELQQYYYKNWMFDEVRGEPVLEFFVKKAFNAKIGDDPSVKVVKKEGH